VSGLELGSKQEQQFRLQMFVDIVTGQLGSPEQQAGTANIVSVVVAGNSLSKDTQCKDSLTKVGNWRFTGTVKRLLRGHPWAGQKVAS